MMLTDEQLDVLVDASRGYGRFGDDQATSPADFPRVRQLALDALGNPSDDAVVAAALAWLRSDDRNRRVAALRVLAWYRDRANVADALLEATADPARRVRRIAVGLVPVGHPGAVERLLTLATEDEHARIAAVAFLRVARRDLAPETVESIRGLLDSEQYRRKILHVFLTQSTPAGAEPLLEEIVRVGSKREAVASTRALCGYRIVRRDQFPNAGLRPADVDWLFAPGTMARAKYVTYCWLPPSS
jgi:hypothetical protein